ncbi:MBOAT, membrane-bound O-acyltransferase family-domain-containing protein [Gorgonomyces haynaldii]|nr:MBOAT, membrane-bound O-acyltransferase family-domain-containing protein [Gorgonomyces haynaldii]
MEVDPILGTGIVLVLNIVLARYFKFLTPTQQHLYSVVVSTVGFLVLFDLHTFTKIVYLGLFVWLSSRYFAQFHWGPVFVFAQIVLDGDTKMDQTAPLMVMVQKLSSFAWSCRDGVMQENKLTPRQKKDRVTEREYPSILEFAGYVFFFPGFLVGPSCSFSDYIQFVNRRGDFKSIPEGREGAAMKALGWALGSGVLMAVLAPTMNHDHLVLLSLTAAPIYKKLFVIFVAGSVARFRFYCAWKASEAACILTGLGYAGPSATLEERWSRLENVNIPGVELSQTPRDVMIHWNKNTANWLREDVYVRLMDLKVPRTVGTLLTSLTSAFWHGFYSGYYITFLSGALVTSCARLIRRHIRPLFLARFVQFKPLYDVISIITTQFIINYIIASFMVQKYDESMIIYKAVYFIPHFMLLLITLLLSQRPIASLLQKIVKKAE